MRKILHITIVSLLAVISSLIISCSEEFLTREPPGVVAGSLLTTPDAVESMLVSAYAALAGKSRFGGAMGTDWTCGSVYSDDCYKGTSAGDSSPLNELERYEINPYFAYSRERWRDCYSGVALANLTLDCLDANKSGKTPLSAERATQIAAEARFLRAWFHFQANKVFEKIPYIKTSRELSPLLPDSVPNIDPGWEEIEEDLSFAINNLPETHPRGEVGRACKYAAEAVKAQAHMYQKEFSEAKTLLDNILNNGGYELAPQFYHNYDMIHENNRESIFEIQASTTATTYSSLLISGVVFHQTGPASCGGWGFFQPSQCLFEAFQVSTEGHRFFDLRRWDIDEEVLTDYIARDCKFRLFLRGANYDPLKDDYWPLPYDQITLQAGALKQDSSYVL